MKIIKKFDQYINLSSFQTIEFSDGMLIFTAEFYGSYEIPQQDILSSNPSLSLGKELSLIIKKSHFNELKNQFDKFLLSEECLFDISKYIEVINLEEVNTDFLDTSSLDPMFVDIARIVVINQEASASMLQRKLSLGYNRAGRVVDQLEAPNIIGPFEGSTPRKIHFQDIEDLDSHLRSLGLI